MSKQSVNFGVFVNYYRRLIKDYSKVARPLYDLISGDIAKKRTNPLEWSE